MNVKYLIRASHYARLCIYKQIGPGSINAINYKTNVHSSGQARNYSIQSSVESTVKSQNGIFQSISESVPVEYLQKFLISVHDQSGLPWWVTIVSTTIILRSCITMPFAIYQQYILAKVENINLEMPTIAKELQRETSIAVKLYKWDEKTARYQYRRSVQLNNIIFFSLLFLIYIFQLKKQWNKLIIRDNCHPFKASILLWFQIPLWICYSISLRNLVYLLPKNDIHAQIIYTELSLGGFGWIPNLTAADSSYILPILLGIINLAIIEIQTLSKLKPSTKFQKYLTNFFRGVSIIMIPIAGCVPSCLVLYWTTSSTFGLLQNLFLMSPNVKRFCGIPKTASEFSAPYKHVINSFKSKYLKLN